MQLALLIRPVLQQVSTRRIPRAMMTWRGKLLHIHIAPAVSYEMEDLAEAQLIARRAEKRSRKKVAA
ncbi:hypothetical protein NKH74_32900 [Mesorhizobium sp. M0933]